LLTLLVFSDAPSGRINCTIYVQFPNNFKHLKKNTFKFKRLKICTEME